MPELPEVQTIVNDLKSKINGKKIVSFIEKRKGTIIHRNKDLEITGRIKDIGRRGKYIIINSQKEKIIIHLRMTGKLIYEKELSQTSTHSRAEFIFSDNTKLIFDDIRTFGKIWILEIYEDLDTINKLGEEPLKKEFDKDYLKRKVKQRNVPIKSLMLDQKIIAGLGNIYVCEILFRAKVNPLEKGKNLSDKQIIDLVKQTKIVLSEALNHNGTTISDYRRVDDKKGEFQNFLKVYQKEYCECGSKISKIKISGRSTYYCEKCQTINKRSKK